MSTPTDNLGIEVEIGRIDHELGRLWEEAGETKTRASLLNLVLYTEDPGTLGANTDLIAEIAAEHACRAILILAEPSALESSARAWINAHCHYAGKRQICSEQISFHLCGEAARALPSIVFSHLDSDLPLCLWWQAPFHSPIDASFWAWVDRLVFDSSTWADPSTGFATTAKIGSLAGGRTVIGDLNWARVLGARLALASLFDHPSALSALRSLEEIRITHGPGHRIAATLLMGWLASRFGWLLHDLISESYFTTPDGRQITFRLDEVDGPTISQISFHSPSAVFGLRRPPNQSHYELDLCELQAATPHAFYAAGRERPSNLLLSELARGGRHGHYREAVASISALL
ncbi:MAG: hypothetical protein Fur0032_13040 [Terrimicrobiaceae bacterium]